MVFLLRCLTTMYREKSTAHEQRRSRGESSKLRFGSNRTAPKIWQEARDMIFTVHLNRLIDENTPLEQSTIETCLQEAYKYQKVTKISCDIWSRFEASWLDCVTMMSEMTIAVIVVSASCHHASLDAGWFRLVFQVFYCIIAFETAMRQQNFAKQKLNRER